jgi:glucokinase
MKTYAFGIDIGGTTIKIGLFKTSGILQETWEIPTKTQNQGECILTNIAEAIKAKIEKEQIPVDEIEGLGLGVPGPVGEDGTVYKCVNLGWGIINVENKLRDLTGLKVKAGNDANVAALGEMWQGAGKGYKNVVMATLGTGIGGGIIVGGRILSGTNGAGGEIGHIKMSDDETEVCGCGKRGCLEQYASANGIARMAKKWLQEKDMPSVLRECKTVTSKDIFDAAKAGDALASELVEFLGEKIGTAFSFIACVCDPEIFIIGGGVSKAGRVVADVIQKYYRQAAFHACRNAKFTIAKLGNEAGMYGCVKLLLS